ncbi:MAG: GNAT family N-acetyltransferase [Candidatus Dormibacteraeota bacterium]|nr:GNAT family N-acetyltransferase [Candidatus Dormibacteraeota bacterium]
MSDSERFQTWQRDTLAVHDEGAEMLSIGPFRALLSAADDPAATGWVTLIDGTPTESETVKGLTKLRSVFKKRKVALEIEYNEAAFPKVGPWLEAAGLKLVEKNPLMSCWPKAFKPFPIPEELHLTQLSPAATPAELEAFQTIRWTDGGEIDRPAPSAERLRADIARPNSVFLLAWLEWEPVGTGVSHSLKGAAEIVGVVTRKDRRRRGVAAAITTELVSRHFANSGEFVFLDAANEDAARVYERLGFSRFGANRVYRPQ